MPSPEVTANLESLLLRVQQGDLPPEAAAKHIRDMSNQPLGFATLDHQRAQRCGIPEVVFAENKSVEQVVVIAKSLCSQQGYALITRASSAQSDAIDKAFATVQRGERGGTIIVGPPPPCRGTPIPIVTAGTSDEPVAEEAQLTCHALGQATHRINDVGVAGLGRLIQRLDEMRESGVIICIAGMEGALPSVIGGLVPIPVIAVPTSIGYGASLHGLAALLGMLTSCASGVTVVNIDNGFGAAYSATLIQRQYDGRHE